VEYTLVKIRRLRKISIIMFRFPHQLTLQHGDVVLCSLQ